MEKQKKAAFYCHGLHTSCSEAEYLVRMKKRLSAYPGMGAWETEVFHEKIPSGRSELMRLEAAIRKGEVGVVATLEAATISRDWNVFGEFMTLCEEHGVRVFSLEWWKHDDDAEEQYRLLKEIRNRHR